MNPIGSTVRNQWHANADAVDFIRTARAAIPLAVAATPQRMRFDLARTALIIIDMQNDFCHPAGWLGSIGIDVTANRTSITPLLRMVRYCRGYEVPVIWVNWGNRPDRLNLGPSTHHVYDATGSGGGLGPQVLELGSWGAAIVEEFGDTSLDVHIAKYSMSGFWDTPLDAILRNLGITTLLFGGVNLDQCVLCTLQDASFRGYDCILLEDGCATTSPSFCTEAALYNTRQCFGFVAVTQDIGDAIEGLVKKEAATLVAEMITALDASEFAPSPESRASIVANIGIIAGHAATVLTTRVPMPHAADIP